jgi:hypothetical protein
MTGGAANVRRTSVRGPAPDKRRYAQVTVSTFFLILVGLLLVVFGFLAGGNVAFVGLGVVSLIAAAGIEAVGRRRN